MTAKESSTFKQIDSPGPGHHRQDAGDIVEAIKAETERQRREKISEAARLKQGREKKKEEGKLYGRGNTKDEKVLSIIDRTLYLGVVHLFFMVNIFVRGFLLYGV